MQNQPLIYLIIIFGITIVIGTIQAIRAILTLISEPRSIPIIEISFPNVDMVEQFREAPLFSILQEQYNIIGHVNYGRGKLKMKVHNSPLKKTDLEKIKIDLEKTLSRNK